MSTPFKHLWKRTNKLSVNVPSRERSTSNYSLELIEFWPFRPQATFFVLWLRQNFPQISGANCEQFVNDRWLSAEGCQAARRPTLSEIGGNENPSWHLHARLSARNLCIAIFVVLLFFGSFCYTKKKEMIGRGNKCGIFRVRLLLSGRKVHFEVN
jgi:hypothetical protein